MEKTHGRKRTQWRQWAAGITATMVMVCSGSIYGWITTNMTRLVAEDSPIAITSDEIPWIISLTGIGTLTGPLLGATSSDMFGRKMTLLLAGFFYIIGWLVVIFSTSVEYLYVARVILGMGVGISWTSCPLYVCEIADINIRGALGTLMAVNGFTGMIFACSIGPFVSIKNLSIIMLMIPIIFLCIFIWFPESPYYLVLKDRDNEAVEALTFFKGLKDPNETIGDLEVVKLSINQQSKGQNWLVKFREMMLPNNRRALGIGVVLTITQVMSGTYTMEAYLEVLFQKANIGINTNLATIIVLVMGLIASIMATFTIEKIGRRPLLISSTLGSSIALAALATYLIAGANGLDVTSLNWLPIIVIVLFQLVHHIGVGSVPNALVSEIFSTNVKSIGNAVLMILEGVVSIVVAKLYQVIGDNIGEYVMYYIFAVSCFLGFLYSVAFVPETMNKRFDEIQEDLTNNVFQCFKRRNKV